MIVGVNKYSVPDERPLDILRIPIDLEARQIDRVKRFKQSRDRAGVQAALERVRAAAANDTNLMPPLVQAVQVGCTVGEISDIYRNVFGEYRDPAHL